MSFKYYFFGILPEERERLAWLMDKLDDCKLTEAPFTRMFESEVIGVLVKDKNPDVICKLPLLIVMLDVEKVAFPCCISFII